MFVFRVIDCFNDLKIRGMSQANAEMNFLNKVKRLDIYGVDLQPVLVILNSALIRFIYVLLEIVELKREKIVSSI